jgi:hypothetical protein
MEIALIVLSVLATGAGAPGPCALLARADILAVQKAAVVSEKESAADGKTVEIRRCYYETDPNSKSVSLEWTRDRVPDGARRQWDRLFHPERDEHREDAEKDESDGKGEREERRAASPGPVSGIGEEAYWVSSRASGAIYAFASHAFVRVSVGGEGTDAEKKERAAALARNAIAAAAAPRQGSTPR